jgi:serine/threonine-protein kinase RsbW
MATLAYVELDPLTGVITYACAGHPPPLLLPRDGEPRFLWDGRSAPLGSSFAVQRDQSDDRLEPGDAIVLFTDGLVEQRRSDLSARLDQLLAAAAEAGEGPHPELVERLLDAMLGEGGQDDDVCVLAVRFLPADARFEHRFPARPAEVAAMRAALSGWLEEADVDEEQRREVVLAVSEAAANAAEHGYGFDGDGTVEVEARLVGDELQVEVRDRGAWRTPEADPLRGRGRRIMERLMDDVSIDTSTEGTIVRMSVRAAGRVPA